MDIFNNQAVRRSRLGFLTLSAVLFWATAPLVSTADTQSAYERGYSMYAKGEIEFARIIWEKAASNGNATAAYALGLINYRKEIIGANLEQAIEYFEIAADRGHIGASYNLGVAYLNGSGVSQDDAGAIQYFTQAAELNHSAAQYNLGLMYYQGTEDTPHDRAQGLELIESARLNGHDGATELMALINKRDELEAKAKAKGENALVGVQVADNSTELVSFIHNGPEKIMLRHRPAGIAYDSLPENSEWVVIEESNGWVAIAPKPGMQVWVYNKFVSVDESINVATIAAEGVRGRPSPSLDNTKSPPIGLFFEGERIELLGQQAGWVKVRASFRFAVWIRESEFMLINNSSAG